MRLLSSALIAAAIAAVLAAVAPAGAPLPKLRGTVGPGFTIQLKQGTKRVTNLPPGTYALVVSDRSAILRHGTYRYVCDPHRTLMHGRFTVS